MRAIIFWTSKLGEVAMAVGVLWAYVAGTFRGDNLPVALQNVESALMLAGVGVVTWVGTKAVLRRMDGSARVAALPAQEPYAMPGSPEWDDPVARRRTLDAMNDFAARDLENVKTALDGHFGRAQKRIALRPCWPQRVTDSWVGGLPALPTHMDWPDLNGRPASFQAQIALDGFPDIVWQGVGPRHGWLVFFADPEDACAIAIRHVQGHVEERAQPASVDHAWHWNMAPDGLPGALGSAGHVPPRWYLEIVEEPALGAVEDMVATADGQDGFWDAEKGGYIWAETWTLGRKAYMDQVSRRPALRGGLDWSSFFGILTLWKAMLTERKQSLETRMERAEEDFAHIQARHAEALDALASDPETDDEALDALKLRQTEFETNWQDRLAHDRDALTHLNEVFPTVEPLEVELREMARSTAYDPAVGQELLDLINTFDAGLLAQFRLASEHLIENYARHLYTRDPENMPQELYDLFAPLWELQCRETLIFVGRNHDGTEGCQPDARLVDLPTNPLAGVSFGDESRFYVDLPLAALAEGQWYKATADLSHNL